MGVGAQKKIKRVCAAFALMALAQTPLAGAEENQEAQKRLKSACWQIDGLSKLEAKAARQAMEKMFSGAQTSEGPRRGGLWRVEIESLSAKDAQKRASLARSQAGEDGARIVKMARLGDKAHIWAEPFFSAQEAMDFAGKLNGVGFGQAQMIQEEAKGKRHDLSVQVENWPSGWEKLLRALAQDMDSARLAPCAQKTNQGAERAKKEKQ